uniref:Uncharacterized protein n=1 Tax=Uncultured archaeon GZfos26G2 TaxID=3386331 RepID=Q649V8_UNCAG|nr:hypothetical protein GZ34A6_30 [uncultured archaeon GZfos34A6]
MLTRRCIVDFALAATPSIRGNPTAEHAGGNTCVVSSQDNVENPRTQLRSTAS